jgi:hypothetical protein
MDNRVIAVGHNRFICAVDFEEEKDHHTAKLISLLSKGN